MKYIKNSSIDVILLCHQEVTSMHKKNLSHYRNLCLGIPIIVAAYLQTNFSTEELSSFDVTIVKTLKQNRL